MKKIKFKQKLKNYFTERPKQDFWFWAFITLFIFRYVTPMDIMFLLFFQIGLVAPEVEISNSIEIASETVTNALMKPMEMLFEAGANIGTNNPIIAKILFFGISNVIWVIYIAMFYLIINLSRYFVSWIYRKKVKK